MNNKRISDRAAMLLILIIDYTVHDDNGQRTSFWLPRVGGQPSGTLGGRVWVSGSGDAAVLRSLERRAFIKKETLGAYSASATESGALYFERHIRETGRLAELQQIVAKDEEVMGGRSRLLPSTCRQCGEEYDRDPRAKDDGFCTDSCMDQYNNELDGVATSR